MKCDRGKFFYPFAVLIRTAFGILSGSMFRFVSRSTRYMLAKGYADWRDRDEDIEM